MGFLEALFRTIAALVGLPLTLGGFGGFWYGIYMVFGDKNVSGGILVVVGSAVSLLLGTILGNYAAGE